jgi:hypothetical protein
MIGYAPQRGPQSVVLFLVFIYRILFQAAAVKALSRVVRMKFPDRLQERASHVSVPVVTQ